MFSLLSWNLINDVINKRKVKPSLPSSFNVNTEAVTDPLAIANGFCKYFTNIGPSLAEKLPAGNRSFQSFLPNMINESVIPKPTSSHEVRDLCNSLKSGKAPGYDNVAMTVIKDSLDIISDPLSKIINTSLSNGIFPDKLKIAKVLPVFKSEDPQYFVNYRPIPLLSNFSKVFERGFYNRYIEFNIRLQILYRCQFGSRKNHSTAFSLTYLVNPFSARCVFKFSEPEPILFIEQI